MSLLLTDSTGGRLQGALMKLGALIPHRIHVETDTQGDHFFFCASAGGGGWWIGRTVDGAYVASIDLDLAALEYALRDECQARGFRLSLYGLTGGGWKALLHDTPRGACRGVAEMPAHALALVLLTALDPPRVPS